MNRVLKFRQAHVDKDGVFQYFTYWGTIDHMGNPSLNGQSFMSPSQSSFEKKWHQQFSGLHDKNGVAIWEGDLIKHADDHLCLIVFKNGSFQQTYLNGSEKGITRYISFSAKFCEVVGNEFENKSLIDHYTS